jgi:hypothetical protein
LTSLLVFAESYNVLRILSGMGGLAYVIDELKSTPPGAMHTMCSRESRLGQCAVGQVLVV